MLQLTRKADYGIRLMLEVGAHGNGGMSTAEVARRQNIPYQFLRKVVRPLVAQGLLTSKRGQGGGLSLSRPAETITALEIVRAFGPASLNECTIDPPECDRRALCAGYGVWLEAQSSVERVLRASRLSDMVQRQASLEGARNKRTDRRETRPSRVARKQTAGQQFPPGSAAGEGGNPL
jgi:Rrf2 family protein